MGNLDPTDLINAETNRIPFRAENFSLDYGKIPSDLGPKPPRDGKIDF